MKFGDLLANSEKEYFFIMHLSYDGTNKRNLWNYAKNNSLIGLDQPKIVKNDWVKVRETLKGTMGKGWVRQFDLFCTKIKKDDFVLVLNGLTSVLGIAQVEESKHSYDRNLSQTKEFFDHVRRVQWVKAQEFSNPMFLKEPMYGFCNTLQKVTRDSPRWSVITDLDVAF